MRGVNGKILEIDLTDKSIKEMKVPEEIYKKFLGGYGLGAWYLNTYQKAKVDPLGPENILGIISGMLNATNYPLSGRFMAVSKSPLTGLWTDSNSGGKFGPKLMQSGYDGIFIKGISDTPVYILIQERRTEILDASNIWGKLTNETEDILKEKYKNSEILSIGPAGEKLSLISSIITDKGRALGRSGLGAVMGSKKLKAIVAMGSKIPEFYDKNEVIEIIKKMSDAFKNERFHYWHKYGTAGSTEVSTLNGDAPIKNWKGIGILDFEEEKAKKISGDNVIKDNIKPYACASCPVACGAIIRRVTRYGIVEGHRLEYEGASLFGSSLLNDDMDSIVYSFELCNRYGLDVISTAAAIGFAMECYENGILTEKDLGYSLNWGNPDSIVKTVELIGKSEGIGKILAKGVKIASELIGKGSEKFAMHVHGQELPAHDPRYMPSVGTTYITDPTPGRHTAGGLGFFEDSVPIPSFNIGKKFEKIERYKYIGKGKYQAFISNADQVQNSLGFCRFRRIVPEYATMPYVEMIKAATGLSYTSEELYECGERIQNLRQLFNIREGFNLSENKIPERVIGIPPLQAGPLKGITINIDTLKNEYLDAMDWDKSTGKPSERKIKELGLESFYNTFF